MTDELGVVDLRSDTVTRPTAAMRRAMAEAEVGDDVYGEDPTVNRLEERAALLFGREAALFVPTGSMGNLAAILTWTRPGQEVICDSAGHINMYEMASMSAIAGCLPRTTAAPDGILTWEMIERLIRPSTYYLSQTGLIALENTHNVAGGTVYPPGQIQEICDRAEQRGLKVHLDGARIFNAATALGKPVAELARGCDSIMFCLSKGLGAPVGSLLVGSREFIDQARIHRKRLGGGMRQAGVLAAAGLVALRDTPARLGEDHANAKRLVNGLADIRGIKVEPAKVVTNILMADVTTPGVTAQQVTARLAERRILANAFSSTRIRFVTHYDVDRAGIERAITTFREVMTAASSD
jgi:threonine aldolase